MGIERPSDWLRGVRVLQRDEHLTTSYAGYLLRRLGAEVAVAARDRSAFEGEDSLYELLNGSPHPLPPLPFGNGRGGLPPFDVVIAGPVGGDLDGSAGADLPWAQAVFEPGEGATGYPSELIAEASAAWLMVNGDPGRDNAAVRAPGYQVLLQAGVMLAMLALAAVRDQRRSGRVRRFSLGIRELAIALHNCTAKTSYTGLDVYGRGISETQPSLVAICADGPIFLTAVEEGQWRALCAVIGRPEMATMPEFATRAARWLHKEALTILFQDAVAGQSRAEIADRCAELGVPTVAVYDAGDLLELEQLQAREAWEDGTLAGKPVRLPAMPWTAYEGASVDAPVARPTWSIGGPLEDVRITETSWVWAAPFCSELLGWLGASVVKVESDQHVDFFRRSMAMPGTTPNVNASPSFNQLNLGKKSVLLDLASEAGRAAFWSLLEGSDVFLSNFRPGVLERLGVTPERLLAVPGLIGARISGFGEVGPWANRVLYGAGAVMLGGLGAYTGFPETNPTTLGFAFGDGCSGNYTALAIVAALLHRDANGSGQLIETSITETILNQAVDLLLAHQFEGTAPRLGNAHARNAPQGVYACADGAAVAIAVERDEQWIALARLARSGAEIAALDARARHQRREELDALVGAWAAGRETASAAFSELAAAGVPAALLTSPRDVLTDAALLASGYVAPLEHPVAGTHLMGGAPWQMDGARPVLARAPLLGEHTGEVVSG